MAGGGSMLVGGEKTPATRGPPEPRLTCAAHASAVDNTEM